MKHFHNDEMMAPNVMRIPVDSSGAGALLDFANSGRGRQGLASLSPPWNSDIEWISARSREAFAVFKEEFDRLGIARHVEPFLDLEKSVRLYSGFLVRRSICRRVDFHLDWNDTNNEAFTLLTPLTDNAAGFGLVYERDDGSIGDYEYKVGEALVLGDRFVHSTRPGKSREPVVLLSFTFGTDKMEHWQRIAPTASVQGPLICRPDGSFHESALGEAMVARARPTLRGAMAKLASAVRG